ncbi:uncharacterized protein TNCV_440291 [Trichonephila clavipes]|nr:uncharacterized protein TNCV_440291 [Trichonephila clavipes]
MVKECVHICHSQSNRGSLWGRSNEQTTCSEMASLFLTKRTGCRKPQYGKEWSAKFFTARIEEMIQNDQRATVSEISSELCLSYGRVQHIVSDVL